MCDWGQQPRLVPIRRLSIMSAIAYSRLAHASGGGEEAAKSYLLASCLIRTKRMKNKYNKTFINLCYYKYNGYWDRDIAR